MTATTEINPSRLPRPLTDALPSSSGQVWYASLAGNHIARIDTESVKATVVEPPTPGQGARRVWPDSHGRLWVSEWSSGQLSRYEPATDRKSTRLNSSH